jgi:P27 family predicted phage terminase small subunit
MKGRKPAAKRQMTDPQSTGETGFITTEPPPWLGFFEAETWRQTITALADSGRRIPLAHLEVFIAYCSCAGQARDAADVLAHEGLVADGGRQGLRRHPCVMIHTRALQMLRGYAETLGLTPGSAGRLPQTPIKKPSKYDDL